MYVQSDNDDVVIQGADDVFIYTQGGEDAIIARGDGAVELYYNNSLKLETTNPNNTPTQNDATINFEIIPLMLFSFAFIIKTFH